MRLISLGSGLIVVAGQLTVWEGRAKDWFLCNQRATRNKKSHEPKFVGFLDNSW